MMTTPICTYRLQFRNGMTFARARDLIPHWLRLGISHVYASPIFAAVKDSTHGYDVIDPNRVEPSIGGREGFDLFAAALRDSGLGLILDIVPNHLAASLDNPWWHSVVALGRDSPFAGFFDIDWSRKLTLPVISGSIDEEIAAGNIRLVQGDKNSLAIEYGCTRYPLHPGTFEQVLRETAQPLSPDGLVLRDRRILDPQPWEFIPWRDAPRGLSYRRFFEITGLVGTRVEQEDVFDAMHHTVLEMVREGQIDGLRIDHVDGLADPEPYLQCLRAAVGPSIYIVVEKILEGDEQLATQWPINGTTGYEFIAALADVFTAEEVAALDGAYLRISPEFAAPEAEVRKARLLMIDHNFQGEVAALEKLLLQVATAEETGLTRSAVIGALRELLIAFPVYRTYGSPRGLDHRDEQVLDRVFASIERTDDPEQHPGLLFLRSVLQGEVRPGNTEAAIRFRTRLQHLTGPLIAKALEDTFFYRYNRLLALNEVGGDPLARNHSVARFHARMQQRARGAPTALTATSTHDTKRGEDARARLFTISEAPDHWAAAVERWRGINKTHLSLLDDGIAPEPNTEWMLYQSLAGVWPTGLDIADRVGLESLRDRFLPYVEKALREAKLRTDWTDNNRPYEDAVSHYAATLLSPDNIAFLRDFDQTLRPFIAAGLVNSLSQTLLKLTVPGIPDIYQGCEAYDFSLVDPDNRRLPDFSALSAPQANQANPGGLALTKQDLIAKTLAVRREFPALFEAGDYIPLTASGSGERHIVAFARHLGDRAAVVVAPRMVFHLLRDGLIDAGIWKASSVALPGKLRGMSFREVFTGEVVSGELDLARILAAKPFALLIGT